VIKKVESISESTRRGIRRAYYFIGKDLTDEAQQSIIRGPKTGNLYRIKGRKRRHRASAPGEPPANLSGTLQRSIDFEVQGSHSMEFGAEAPYAGFLELGTKNMEPREYLIRAIENNERNTEFHFERSIKSELIK
jgi:HK97 gp10 family phage protein